jgi:predicted GNAT family N-acyltransferase
MKVELREPTTANDFALYYDLRWRVLHKPWTTDRNSGKDEREEQAIHLMAWADGKLIGVGRLHFNSAEEGQLRYMAVEKEYSREGVGSVILRSLEARAGQAGATHIVLNARNSALSFYEKHGYCLVGTADTLFGSIIHLRMRKYLNVPLNNGESWENSRSE